MLIFDSPTNFRSVLTLSVLSNRPIHITNINNHDEIKGIRDYEINFINMINTITNGTRIVLSKKGDNVKFYPGMIINNDDKPTLKFDCGNSRAISYYLEFLTILALFGKTDLRIQMIGITNDDIDHSVDSLIQVIPNILARFGAEGAFNLKINRRGFRPNGKGDVYLQVKMMKKLTNCIFLNDGLVKRIRGTCYASKASINVIGRIINSARCVFNDFIPDVWIYSEYSKGSKSSKDPGYGLTVVAESNSKCMFSFDKCFNHFGKKEENSPEEIGKIAAMRLVDEIMYSGVVDSSFQSFCLILMAISGPKPSKLKLGRVTSYTIVTLRMIHKFLGVKFKIDDYVKPKLVNPEESEGEDSEEDLEKELQDSDDETEKGMELEKPEKMEEVDSNIPRQVIFTCIGLNLKNKARELL